MHPTNESETKEDKKIRFANITNRIKRNEPMVFTKNNFQDNRVYEKLSKMLQYDPKKRPTAQQVFKYLEETKNLCLTFL